MSGETKKKSYDWDSIMGQLKIPRRQKRAKKAPSGETKDRNIHHKDAKTPKLMPKLMPKETPSVKVERKVITSTVVSATVQLKPSTDPCPVGMFDTKLDIKQERELARTMPSVLNGVVTKKIELATPHTTIIQPTRKKNFCNPGPAWIPGPRPKIQVKAYGRCMRCWKVFQNEAEQLTHDDVFHPTCKQCGLIFSCHEMENHTKLQCRVSSNTTGSEVAHGAGVKIVRKDPVQHVLLNGSNTNLRLVQNPVKIKQGIAPAQTQRLQFISTGQNHMMMNSTSTIMTSPGHQQQFRVMRMDPSKSDGQMTVNIAPRSNLAKHDNQQQYVLLQQPMVSCNNQNTQIILAEATNGSQLKN